MKSKVGSKDIHNYAARWQIILPILKSWFNKIHYRCGGLTSCMRCLLSIYEHWTQSLPVAFNLYFTYWCKTLHLQESLFFNGQPTAVLTLCKICVRLWLPMHTIRVPFSYEFNLSNITNRTRVWDSVYLETFNKFNTSLQLNLCWYCSASHPSSYAEAKKMENLLRLSALGLP